MEDTQQKEKVQSMTWEELFERFEADFEIPEHFEGRPLIAIARDYAWEEWRKQVAAQALSRSWSDWILDAIARIKTEVARGNQDAWTRKLSGMAKSLDLRRKHTPKKMTARSTQHQFGIYKSKTWEEAFIRMQGKIIGQMRKARARKESPWILWSETVAKNHRVKSCSMSRRMS